MRKEDEKQFKKICIETTAIRDKKKRVLADSFIQPEITPENTRYEKVSTSVYYVKGGGGRYAEHYSKIEFIPEIHNSHKYRGYIKIYIKQTNKTETYGSIMRFDDLWEYRRMI